mmetsp:Transcript_17086/g.66545  ORF Transcript_17086/g.66545 Transcript_17086/m.66545 type:complete len:393 (-) Transcript_17086:874-2052(-)
MLAAGQRKTHSNCKMSCLFRDGSDVVREPLSVELRLHSRDLVPVVLHGLGEVGKLLLAVVLLQDVDDAERVQLLRVVVLGGLHRRELPFMRLLLLDSPVLYCDSGCLACAAVAEDDLGVVLVGEGEVAEVVAVAHGVEGGQVGQALRELAHAAPDDSVVVAGVAVGVRLLKGRHARLRHMLALRPLHRRPQRRLRACPRLERGVRLLVFRARLHKVHHRRHLLGFDELGEAMLVLPFLLVSGPVADADEEGVVHELLAGEEGDVALNLLDELLLPLVSYVERPREVLIQLHIRHRRLCHFPALRTPRHARALQVIAVQRRPVLGVEDVAVHREEGALLALGHPKQPQVLHQQRVRVIQQVPDIFGQDGEQRLRLEAGEGLDDVLLVAGEDER